MDFHRLQLPDGRVGYAHLEFVDTDEGSDIGSILATAKQYMGVPYLWGGTSPKGYDCSGFTKSVFETNGYMLPRDASLQVHVGGIGHSIS